MKITKKKKKQKQLPEFICIYIFYITLIRLFIYFSKELRVVGE